MTHDDFLVQLREMEKQLDLLEADAPAEPSDDAFGGLIDCPDIDAFLDEMSKSEAKH